MTFLPEAVISCPYCGETITILVDESAGEQRYIEDCQVCCRPMVIRLTIGEGGVIHVEAHHENDGFTN
jgi:hypothetical protein